jgi:hypothetical protein
MTPLRRRVALAALLVVVVRPEARADTSDRSSLVLFADTDDDDGDGIADRDEDPSDRANDVEWLTFPGRGVELLEVRGESVRVLIGGRSVVGRPLPRGRNVTRVGIQGLRAGTTTLAFTGRVVEAVVCDVTPLDADGRPVSMATSHASLSRTLPAALAAAGEPSDADALAWHVTCPKGALPRNVRIQSIRPNGDPLDAVESAALLPASCAANLGEGFECAVTERIRATTDLADRVHPTISDRSLRAEVGGRLVVQASGRKATSIRVGGPRQTPRGAIDRFRGKLRFHVVRAATRGEAAVGGGDESARNLVRDEARTVSMLWGQCGIHFGGDEQISVDVVDPPPQYLAAIGCDLGLPASGGVITLGVGSQSLSVHTRSGDSPVTVAHAIASAAKASGLRPTVSPNARILPGALRTADVSFRRADGAFAEVRVVPSTPLSTDATLGVCLGEVNLGDGLSHFEDLDAAAGTVEERALVRAYLDDDPSTIEVFIVPSFSKTGRIGESFIDADGTGIQNAVIVDRAAIRSGARSYALAHEIGHVLLDMPGHPDDFGVDRPWVLMDADAADSSIFGPRRLSVQDCERALVQSGPGSAMPLLEHWPLYKTRAKTLPKPLAP